MPNHFHLLLTPRSPTTLERALQLIKGGFSFRAGKELGWRKEIWQTSFVDRRVRDAAEYAKYREYILQKPVAARLCAAAQKYPFSFPRGAFAFDGITPRPK